MLAWERLTKGVHVRLKKYAQPGLEWAYKYYARMDRTRAYVVTLRKCLCGILPQIIRLIVICSPEPRHTYDVGNQALGTRIHHDGQDKYPENGKFIYMGAP